MIHELHSRHRILIRDRVRMAAYRRAIRAVVRPGDVVADLGTGTGFLAFEAIAAGARHVHAVEVDAATLALAKEETARRGLTDRITFYRGLSQRIRPKERVDVVVTETLGNFGLNENIATVLVDAKQRWLKRGGRIIPRKIALTLAPLGCTPNAKRYGVGGLASIRIVPKDLLGTPVMLPSSPPPSPARGRGSTTFEATCVLPIRRNGLLKGFAGWFTVWLTDTIAFTTAPDAPSTHWQQAFLPLRKPIPVRAGQQLQLWLEIAPDQSGLQSIVSYDFTTLSLRGTK